jgi:hypothetical protein
MLRLILVIEFRPDNLVLTYTPLTDQKGISTERRRERESYAE